GLPKAGLSPGGLRKLLRRDSFPNAFHDRHQRRWICVHQFHRRVTGFREHIEISGDAGCSTVMTYDMFPVGVAVAKPVAISALPARSVNFAGRDQFGMRFVEQLVTEERLLKSHQVRRRGKTASGRAPLDLASTLVIPDFGLRLSVQRHSGITDRQIWDQLPWLVET